MSNPPTFVWGLLYLRRYVLGWLDKILGAVEIGADAIERLTGRSPEREAEPPAEWWAIRDRIPEFDLERDIPQIGSLPPDEPPPLTSYEKLVEEMRLDDGNQRIAKWALFAGWFDMDREPDERVIARRLFFEETGMEKQSFPWHAWREWYASAA